MRADLGAALVAFGALFATSSMTQVSQEQAFNLCIVQPLLKSDFLVPIIDEMLSKPHDPAADHMSKAQILNDIQYYQGTACAAELVAHPDAFGVIAEQHFVSAWAWESAWDAFNHFCRQNLTGACIQQETDGAVAIRELNSHGVTRSFNLCSVVLAPGAGNLQLKACMDAVGDPHPNDPWNDDMIPGCMHSMQWNSQKDGAVAGRKITECFKKGG
jgi:hypothetical protein